MAIPVVNEKLGALRRDLPDERQLAYIHKIDNVLFMHGGLTDAFVKLYASDVDYDDTDAVIDRVKQPGDEGNVVFRISDMDQAAGIL